jgi:hypothetical protein
VRHPWLRVFEDEEGILPVDRSPAAALGMRRQTRAFHSFRLPVRTAGKIHHCRNVADMRSEITRIHTGRVFAFVGQGQQDLINLLGLRELLARDETAFRSSMPGLDRFLQSFHDLRTFPG